MTIENQESDFCDLGIKKQKQSIEREMFANKKSLEDVDFLNL